MLVPHLQGPGELVIAAAHQEVDLAVGEDVLGLEQLAGVALVEEIVNTIGVDPDPPGNLAPVRHLPGDPGGVVHCPPLPRRLLVCAQRRCHQSGARGVYKIQRR